jgi:L-amino acid N-acyltransferase YncA
VAKHHRHHQPPQGGIFAVAVSDGEKVRGVAIVGRPVARMASDGWTAEVTRVCTDGARNACSMLYRAAWRACRAMGYRKLITYTLAQEGGASLRGAGFQLVGQAGGGSWSRRARPRIDTHPMQEKLRWELHS